MRRHIRNYERPEGWSKGQPEVLVTKNVVKKLGEPVVNYGGLHRFLTDDIGLPYNSRTYIKLYGRSSNATLGGYHCPYTRTVYVNPLFAEKHHALSGGTMRILAHELRHRGDSANRKAVTAIEIGARFASFKVGLEVAELLPVLSTAPIIGALVTRQAWYVVEPPEKRARKQERELATSTHQTDILFPNTIRAALMTAAGYVPEAAAERLFEQDELDTLASVGQANHIRDAIPIRNGGTEQVFRHEPVQPLDYEQ